ncbi:MAG: hypothetical protein ACLRFO_01235 [Alphaproteobacteria bacterium]
MTQTLAIATAEKFHNAEQLWFWFLHSRCMRSNNLIRMNGTPTRRPCEILDVETLITKLYLSGKLTDEQLNIMKKFGDKRRAPHQHIWTENRATHQWEIAMNVLSVAAKQRGWIE